MTSAVNAREAVSSRPGKNDVERFLLWLTAACAEWKWYGFASNDVTSCHFQNKYSSSLHVGHQTNNNIHHLRFSRCPSRFPSFSSSTGRKLLGLSGTGFHGPNALPIVTTTVSQYTHTICTACLVVRQPRHTADMLTNRRQSCLFGTGCRQTWSCSGRQTHFVQNWKHFCLSLSLHTREHADLICFVMRPRSTSRGRNINTFLLLLPLLKKPKIPTPTIDLASSFLHPPLDSWRKGHWSLSCWLSNASWYNTCKCNSVLCLVL